jgi:hypothetical protein
MKSSQKVERMARFRAFHDELIYNYLPEGVFVHQVVEGNGVMELNTNQTLQIMQAMCRDSRRQAGNGVFDCVAELKCAPYFRIFDVVNAVRMGTPVPTFDNWDEFVEETDQPGRRIDRALAKQSAFLEPLLQNPDEGPRERRIGGRHKGPIQHGRFAGRDSTFPNNDPTDPATYRQTVL